MRILVTNDDGIESEGLEVLKKIALKLSDDVWVVAPESNQSGVSHSLTLHNPLRERKLDDKTYAISGTPTDCVLMGVLQLMQDKKPDLVLSGINIGRNAADDVTYSGTVAGAIEGTLLDIPSIALSQAYSWDENAQSQNIHWQTPLQHGPALISKLLETGWPEDVFLNINFPHAPPQDVEGTEITRQGQRDQNLTLKYEKRLDMSKMPYYWLYFRRGRAEPEVGTDLSAMQNNKISVTPLHLDLTHEKTLADMKAKFES